MTIFEYNVSFGRGRQKKIFVWGLDMTHCLGNLVAGQTLFSLVCPVSRDNVVRKVSIKLGAAMIRP